jgi:hypothetical protein
MYEIKDIIEVVGRRNGRFFRLGRWGKVRGIQGKAYNYMDFLDVKSSFFGFFLDVGIQIIHGNPNIYNLS